MGGDEIIIRLANSLNKFRSLDEQETNWLEAAVRRDMRGKFEAKRRWTEQEDQSLSPYLNAPLADRVRSEIAESLGRTEDAVLSRLRELRRLHGIARPRSVTNIYDSRCQVRRQAVG